MTEAASLGFGAVFLLGFSFGAGPCNIACLPFLGPVFLASGDTLKTAWRTIVPFSLGRLAGYSLLGTCAGGLGYLVEVWLESKWPGFILGYAAVLLALAMLFRPKTASNCHSKHAANTNEHPVVFHKHSGSVNGSLFLLGIGMAFNPCAPLSIVIAASAATGSALSGLLLGSAFGLGSVILPAVIFSLGIAHFGHTVRQALLQWQKPLEKASIGMLLLMGTATALGYITL